MNNHIESHRNVIREARKVTMPASNLTETTHVEAIAVQLNSALSGEEKTAIKNGKAIVAIKSLIDRGISKHIAKGMVEMYRGIMMDSGQGRDDPMNESSGSKTVEYIKISCKNIVDWVSNENYAEETLSKISTLTEKANTIAHDYVLPRY